MSSFVKPAAPMLAAIEHPRCARCSNRMALIRLESRKDGFEKRTFGCAECKLIESKMIADPLKSDAVARLADSMRPPS